ncbi:MAG: hypothetical protein CMF52_06610 [Legionellales bacterium]|nr:hypothetical protein [Legionellales bacterium]|tara:strand:+ start:10240 stop:10827 length:588 start_codon:yes stop_codon:yes gene_type:complete
MSDSRLLKENTIRRFMKLANVESLTDNFISEMSVYKKHEEDEVKENSEAEAEETLEEQEEETIEEQEEEAIEEQEEGDDDLDLEDDLDDPAEEPMMGDEGPGAADISLTEEEAQLLIDLGERLTAAMASDDDMGDMDDDMSDMDDDMAGMDDDLEGAGEEDDMAAKSYDNPVMQEDLVQEVLKRVTKRILAKKSK